MRYASLYVLLSSILVLAALTAAQDRPAVDDVLRWFPEGAYSWVVHFEVEKIQRAQIYPLFAEVFGEAGFNALRGGPVPPAMREGMESFSYASLVNLKGEGVEYLGQPLETTHRARQIEFNTGDSADGEKPAMPPTITMTTEKGKKILFLDEDSGEVTAAVQFGPGAELWVLRFADFDLRIRDALKSGALEETEHKIDGRPVFSAPDERKEGRRFFAYAAVTGELLLVEDLRVLEKMVGAGNGLTPSLLDAEEAGDIKELSGALGQAWAIKLESRMNRRMLEAMLLADAGVEAVEGFEQKLAFGPQYVGLGISLDGEISDTTIVAFADENAAEDSLSREGDMALRWGNEPRPARDLIGQIGRRQTMTGAESKTEREGPWLVSTTACGAEALEKQKKATGSDSERK